MTNSRYVQSYIVPHLIAFICGHGLDKKIQWEAPNPNTRTAFYGSPQAMSIVHAYVRGYEDALSEKG